MCPLIFFLREREIEYLKIYIVFFTGGLDILIIAFIVLKLRMHF